MLQDLNQNHEQIEVQPETIPRPAPEETLEAAPQAEEIPEPEPEEIPSWEDLDQPFEEDDPAAEWAEVIEDTGSGYSSAEEIDSLAEAAVDIIEASKEGLAEFYDSRFGKIIKRKFTEDKKPHLILVEFLYQSDNLNLDSVVDLLEKMQAKSSEFDRVNLLDLLEVANEYKSIRRRYRTKELHEKIAAGIKRNLKLTLQKNMQSSPDPGLLLGVYLIAAFSSDAINIFSIIKEERSNQ